MNILQEVQKVAIKKVPNIKVGSTVRVHQKIKEGEKERIQIFEGLVIKMNSGHGADKSITVRKIVEGIGVEKIFPVFSPNIQKIEVKKQSKVRRAKLYYMRERSGKSARLKESFVKQEAEEVEKAVEELAEQKAKEEAEKTANEETAAQEQTPAQEQSPAQESPKEETVPAEEAAPTEETAPTEESAPAEETAPEEAPEKPKE